MVITMTNDKVTVIDITEQQYEEALLNGNLYEYNNYIIYECDKLKYVPIKMQIELNIKGRSDIKNINAYYYDNGITMTKKMVNSLFEILYYEDENKNLWPSKEYCLNKQNSAMLDYSKTELIELDSKLNRCEHIKDILSHKKYTEFIRLYESLNFYEEKKKMFNYDINDNLLSRFHIINTKGKLIVRKNNKKLTASQLVNCIYFMVAEAGISDTEEVKYFYKKYEITSLDVDEINKIFRRLLREDNVKAKDMQDEDRYNYLNMAVSIYVKKLYSDMQVFTSKKDNIVSNETKTWSLLKATFLKESGYTLGDYDSTWTDFDTITIDDRLIMDGTIVPLVIESEDYKIDLVEDKKPRFFSEDAIYELEPHSPKFILLPLDEDKYKIDEEHAGDLTSLDTFELQSSLDEFSRSESASLDEQSSDEEIAEVKTDGEVINMSDNVKQDIDLQDLFSSEIDATLDSATKVEDDLSDLFSGDIDAKETTFEGDELLDRSSLIESSRMQFAEIIDGKSLDDLFFEDIDIKEETLKKESKDVFDEVGTVDIPVELMEGEVGAYRSVLIDQEDETFALESGKQKKL